jgi:peptidyl-tRNA hydrolase
MILSDEQQESKSPHIAWHPAFIQALEAELSEYKDALEFHSEYQLTSEPLKIDCVVIKKTKNAEIKKNIAAIFREWNLLEYKSPDDYISITDFYKVYGYACLYSSFNKAAITSLTISFVVSHHPEKLLEHLKDIRSYTVAEISPGIYNISGDIIPIQVINCRQIPESENLWLKCLSNRLDAGSIDKITVLAHRQDKMEQLKAYLYVIAQANPDALQEAIKMSNSTLTLEQVFENVGWTAKWEARGETKGIVKGKAEEAITIARNMIKLGFPIESVISATQLEPEKVKELYQ